MAKKKHIKRTEIAERIASEIHVSKKKAYRDIAPMVEMIEKR